MFCLRLAGIFWCTSCVGFCICMKTCVLPAWMGRGLRVSSPYGAAQARTVWSKQLFLYAFERAAATLKKHSIQEGSRLALLRGTDNPDCIYRIIIVMTHEPSWHPSTPSQPASQHAYGVWRSLARTAGECYSASASAPASTSASVSASAFDDGNISLLRVLALPITVARKKAYSPFPRNALVHVLSAARTVSSPRAAVAWGWGICCAVTTFANVGLLSLDGTSTSDRRRTDPRYATTEACAGFFVGRDKLFFVSVKDCTSLFFQETFGSGLDMDSSLDFDFGSGFRDLLYTLY
ncbi:hypothetical protein MBM_08414 [Drepanopeziza brunnea f. sp. 'multigermtubi' MB_m1]|uniref:Uncharacterized protein n=1 Tax=Marssonina brunnea f. sp. multigermtubi (strain MB_m1) TaxID=1072389 RepID=K1WKC0_MARBU|nr:uncharacterized protein MBM_08414 [Drepanopeziza brunnea f. sp. 'multigermtubi' MB_m1]EKD13331.1 hypothetical protein MBM_08414 [Drepanopeziza brunnea f. sp. 'multigermtubi' MB_m1]